MIPLPLKLNLKIFEVNGKRYAFDQELLNVFEMTQLFADMFQLFPICTEEDLITELRKLYSIDDIHQELEDIKNLLVNGRLSYVKPCETKECQENHSEEMRCDLIQLKPQDFTNDQLIEKLNKEDHYLIIQLEVDHLKKSDFDFQAMKQTLAIRQGRYRINIWMNDNDFVGTYKLALFNGLNNVDLRFDRITDLSWSEEELFEVKSFLVETMTEKEGPALAVIRDILRVLGYQLSLSHCAEECWARWICGNIMCLKGSEAHCRLLKIYCEIGILYFINYLEKDINGLHVILAEDLKGKFTSLERGIFRKNYFWSNSFRFEMWEKMQNFLRTENKSLITYKDCIGE